jgi:hypothetical protein
MTARRKQPLTHRLTELGEAVAAAGMGVRDVETEHEAATAALARIGEERVEAFSVGDDEHARQLAADRAQAEAHVAELAERAEGACRAQQRAKTEQAEYATHHLPDLLRERRPDGEAAAQAVMEALSALQSAYKQWQAVEADSMALMRLSGADTRSQPRFPPALEGLLRDLKRAGGVEVPVPVPSAPTAGRASAGTAARTVQAA